MNAKETARQIKKELNAAFNNGKSKEEKIKFSVTSEYVRGIGYDRISISWVGGVFINQVQEITQKYDTYINHSDTMTDYFRAEGIRIEYRRDLDQSDVDFLTEYVLADFPVNYEVTFKKCYDSEGFKFTIKMDGDYLYRSNNRYQQLTQYNETGAITEEIDPWRWEKAWQSVRQIEDVKYEALTPAEAITKILELPGDLSTYSAEYGETAEKLVERLAGLSNKEWLIRFEIKGGRIICNEYRNPDSLKDGDYQNGDPVCVTIHWAEGKQIYKEEAKFGSFMSAQKALEEIALGDTSFNEPDTGYTKVKFSIHWNNGEAWEEGRIDLACDDENPFELGDFDNLFQKHIISFLEWHIDNGMDSERFTREGVDEWLATHPLSDADLAVTVPNVISLAEFKAKQQQDEICRKLSGFLAQMPRDRQSSIMNQIKVANDPNAYMQSLLRAMESIESSGF
jgi:hypothetical protein